MPSARPHRKGEGRYFWPTKKGKWKALKPVPEKKGSDRASEDRP